MIDDYAVCPPATPVYYRERSTRLLAIDALELALEQQYGRPTGFSHMTQGEAAQRKQYVRILIAAAPWLVEDIADLQGSKP